MPPFRLAKSFAHHPRADGYDEPGFFGQRDEPVGREQTPLGVLPPQQRLGPDHALASQQHDGLVVQDEFAALHRAPQVGFQLQALPRLLVHGFVEDHVTRPALEFGAAQRGAGAAQQVVGALLSLGTGGDADARIHPYFLALHPLRLRERRAHPPRHRDRFGHVHDAAKQHHELVAAEPRHRVAGPHAVLKGRGDLPQDGVPEGVAERVVDALEVVDVDEQQREQPVAAAAARQRVLEPLEQ